MNLSDYKFRQEHRGKYEKKTSLLRAPQYPSRSDETPLTKESAGNNPHAVEKKRILELSEHSAIFLNNYTVEHVTNDIGASFYVGYDRLSDKQVLSKFFAEMSTWEHMKSLKTLVCG